MRTTQVDVVVIGLGAMGSAAVYQLAKAGATVLGLDRHRPPHQLGSSHGDTRITRLGVGEGPQYVPLVKRSHEIWRDLEAQTGEELMLSCGGLVMAGPDAHTLHGTSEFLARSIDSAAAFGTRHEVLAADEIRSRFPVFAVRREESAYFEPTAGVLRPERCVEAQLRLAREQGAEIAVGEPARWLSDDGGSVTVMTSSRTVTATTAIVAAGPWVGELVPDLAARFRVYRQVMYWFDLADRAQYELYRTLPVYIWEFGGTGRDQFIYGFPMLDGPAGGAKVATEDYTTTTTPETVSRAVTDDEVGQMYDGYVADQLPGLSPRCLKAVSCLYTVTPDHHFVIDRHPAKPNVLIASPCSGHGFKHSAAIGEILAQLVTQGRSDIDVTPFALRS